MRLETVRAHHTSGAPRASHRPAAPDGARVHYERHRPEQTTLYRLMQQHAASFIAHTEASTCAELHRFIKDEFDAFPECVGEAEDGDEAQRQTPALRPDVELMEISMPSADGIEAISPLRPTMPSTRFVVLTSSAEPAEVKRALAAGAAGHVLKNTTSVELGQLIRGAHAGRRVLAPELTDAMTDVTLQPASGANLTARERELLALTVRGLNNQEIAAELKLPVPTVKFHITNILAKLQVESRTEAVLKALESRIMPAS